ncbi:hypothetical protein [Kitasatospora sp. NPDC057223]|uniref:hypothetical protein n=1 Tax=Kitasatospora sp. NPDC057223 TaxID=3346055 RepID=UPI003629A05C
MAVLAFDHQVTYLEREFISSPDLADEPAAALPAGLGRRHVALPATGTDSTIRHRTEVAADRPAGGER